MDDCIIVIPCYNEAERFDPTAFQRFIRAGNPQRFLLVDDGSTDRTQAILWKLQAWHPDKIEVYVLPQNSGKAEAVRQGVLHACASGAGAVAYWDADLATPLEEIPRFMQVLDDQHQLQLVIGTRLPLLGHRIQRKTVRRWLGRLFAKVAAAVLGLPIYDTQCGAKMFRVTPEVRSLFERPFLTKWIFDVELLARWVCRSTSGQAIALTQASYELPLHTWRDVAGSKLRAADFLRAVYELGQIYWYYLRPGASPAAAPTSARPQVATPTTVTPDSRRHAA